MPNTRSYVQTKKQALSRLKKWYSRSQIPYTGLCRTKETYDAEMGLNAAKMAMDALEREIKAEAKLKEGSK